MSKKKATKAKVTPKPDFEAIKAWTVRSGHHVLTKIAEQIVELDGILASGRLDQMQASGVAIHADIACLGLSSMIRTLRAVLDPAPAQPAAPAPAS